MSDHEYARVHVPDIENTPNPTREKKEVDEAVGASAFGFNVYTADPGERLPWGYHRHPDHEELFYVLAGELHVETADGTERLDAEDAFFVPENAPVSVEAVGDRPARVIAVGAPKDSDRAIIEEECPTCGEVTGRTHEVAGDEYVLYCDACGAEVTRFD